METYNSVINPLQGDMGGVIANQYRKVLPLIIGLDQKGYVDGRYMGEVTRTLYDTDEDAFYDNKKKE